MPALTSTVGVSFFAPSFDLNVFHATTKPRARRPTAPTVAPMAMPAFAPLPRPLSPSLAGGEGGGDAGDAGEAGVSAGEAGVSAGGSTCSTSSVLRIHR